MFWKKKNKGGGKKETPQATPPKTAREQIIAQAKANAAAARAEIGDETLEKIKEAMLKKQSSAIEKAKAQIKAADKDKVRDHLSLWLQEDRKK
jgi:hypothetical protein